MFDITFSGDNIIAAGDNGIVYCLKDKTVTNKFKAHNQAIPCIEYISRGGTHLLMTVANDGKISLWDGEDLHEQFKILD